MEQLAVRQWVEEEKEVLAQTREPLRFSATGGEYFRIWIVNVLLSIVTLGIYSAWAKVRRNQYFYNSTTLAGNNFDYHGRPLAILKGRIAALVIFGAYNVAFRISPVASLVMFVLMMAILPWLTWKSLQFKLFNSSYRGIRFGFKGSAGQAYLHFLLLPLMTLIIGVFLLLPFTHQRIKRFQHSESRFGTANFSFDAGAGSFYKAYLLCAAAVVPLAALLFFAMAVTLPGPGAGAPPASEIAHSVMMGIFSVYGALFVAYPLFTTMMQNLVWNHTALGPHRFASNMKWGRLTFIVVTNLVGIICTLGLFIPFAQVRSMKYRLESTALLVQGSLDDFVADTQEQVDAAGEGMLDLLDFDLSM